MAYEGLTEDQRAQVRDAGRALQSALSGILTGTAGDTIVDIGLRRVEAYELLRKFFEAETLGWVIPLRQRDVPWPTIGRAAGLGRGGAESRWAKKITERTAATTAPTVADAAVSAVETAAADA